MPDLQLFSKAGDIKRLIMGLDATKRTPCGFCFVSYFTRKDAEAAVKYISGSMMDGRPIRVDHDWGFVEGRQFGRGKSGGQVRADPCCALTCACSIWGRASCPLGYCEWSFLYAQQAWQQLLLVTSHIVASMYKYDTRS